MASTICLQPLRQHKNFTQNNLVWAKCVKCGAIKMSTLKYCSGHILSPEHRNFKILASTPHNYGVIMGGRHKNFEDLMLWAWDMTWAIFQRGHFYCSTLYNSTLRSLGSEEQEEEQATSFSLRLTLSLAHLHCSADELLWQVQEEKREEHRDGVRAMWSVWGVTLYSRWSGLNKSVVIYSVKYKRFHKRN